MNPFEQLRADDAGPASTPDVRFARRLKAQIEAALGPDIDLPDKQTSEREKTMTESSTLAGTQQIITPYISVHDGVAALDWYAAAFGATETMRYTGDDGRIGHAELVIKGARIYLSDAYPEIGVVAATSYDGSSCALHIEVDDVDAMYASAVEQGATGQRAPEDQTHGSRSATIMDPYGHRWMLNQQIASPTIADIDAATVGFTVEGESSGGA